MSEGAKMYRMESGSELLWLIGMAARKAPLMRRATTSPVLKPGRWEGSALNVLAPAASV